MNIQIFGSKKSSDTKKALRFFKERGIKPQFVDLQQREIALGEIKRFVDKFGIDALINKKEFEKQGLGHYRLAEKDLLAKLIADHKLMVQPLVRAANVLEPCWREAFWKDWYKSQKQ